MDAAAIVGYALESIRGDSMLPNSRTEFVPEPHLKLFEALIGTS